MEVDDMADFDKLAAMSPTDQAKYWDARIERARLAEEKNIAEIARKHTEAKAARKLAAMHTITATPELVPTKKTGSVPATISSPTNGQEDNQSASTSTSKSKVNTPLEARLPRKRVASEACRQNRQRCTHDEVKSNFDLLAASQYRRCDDCRNKHIACAHNSRRHSNSTTSETAARPISTTPMDEDSEDGKPLLARQSSSKTDEAAYNAPEQTRFASTPMDVDSEGSDVIRPAKRRRSNSKADQSHTDDSMSELESRGKGHRSASGGEPSLHGIKIQKKSVTTANEDQKKSASTQGQPMRTPKSLMNGSFANMQFSTVQVGTATTTARAAVFSDTLLNPDWNRTLSKSERDNSARDLKRDIVFALQKLKDEITKAENNRKNTGLYRGTLDSIRTRLHTCEYMEGVNQLSVRESRILHPDAGLPRLFRDRIDGFRFAFDIRADAKSLWKKWCRTDFDPDILRGITSSKGASGTGSRSLTKNYSHRLDSKFFGSGDLVSGQWWPLQLCALRDGAHGEMQAGIAGIKEHGATSIILAGGQHDAGRYEDKDDGNVIQYCGTKGSAEKPSDDTTLLHDNIRNRKPVRVIRNSKLGDKSNYTPSFGFRFDGVYDVVDYEVLDASKYHHRFRLERQTGQDPIRHQGLGARPTAEDIIEFQKHRLQN